jgi:hypothetical protein
MPDYTKLEHQRISLSFCGVITHATICCSWGCNAGSWYLTLLGITVMTQVVRGLPSSGPRLSIDLHHRLPQGADMGAELVAGITYPTGTVIAEFYTQTSLLRVMVILMHVRTITNLFDSLPLRKTRLFHYSPLCSFTPMLPILLPCNI